MYNSDKVRARLTTVWKYFIHEFLNFLFCDNEQRKAPALKERTAFARGEMRPQKVREDKKRRRQNLNLHGILFHDIHSCKRAFLETILD